MLNYLDMFGFLSGNYVEMSFQMAIGVIQLIK